MILAAAILSQLKRFAPFLFLLGALVLLVAALYRKSLPPAPAPDTPAIARLRAAAAKRSQHWKIWFDPLLEKREWIAILSCGPTRDRTSYRSYSGPTPDDLARRLFDELQDGTMQEYCETQKAKSQEWKSY